MTDPASAPPPGAGAPVGLPVTAGIAGSVIEWLGFPPSLLALGLAAAGLGMAHAATMPRWQALCVWLCSSLCAAVLGTGLAELAWLLTPAALTAGRPVPSSLTGLCVIVSGIAMHPFIAWVGDRFPALADSAARRAGLSTTDQEPPQ